MSVKYDPLASQEGQKVQKALDLVQQGEEPVKALKKSRVDLDKIKDGPLNEIILRTLSSWYVNNVELEMATKAALMRELMTAEESGDRVKAAKELRGWVQDNTDKAAGLQNTVNILTERDVEFLNRLPLDIEDETC